MNYPINYIVQHDHNMCRSSVSEFKIKITIYINIYRLLISALLASRGSLLNGTFLGDEEVFGLQVPVANHVHVDVGNSTP